MSGDGTEWIDADLPTPNYFYRYNSANGTVKDSYCIGYLIDGSFHTLNGINYLNDIVARFILTLSIKQRILYESDQNMQHNTIYKLKDFQNLKSMTKKPYQKNEMNGNFDCDDNTFWELKLWVEHNIRSAGGEGNIVCFDSMLSHALYFYTYKDKSTMRAKCRNIWAWYEQRDWKYHILKRKTQKTEEEIKMTRQERAKANSVAKAEKSRKKVINAITGLYAHELKKKNGKWHISKIAETTNLDRDTVSKYLKELNNFQ